MVENDKAARSGGDSFKGGGGSGSNFRKLLFWVWPLVGFLSLVWFLVRVIPKPSRASYPCQRAAFPIASGFVIWVTGLLVSAFALRRAKVLFARHRFLTAFVCMLLAVVAGIVSISNFRAGGVYADDPAEAHGVLGVGRGIYRGRVVWVHDPNATNWVYEKVSESWGGIDTAGAGYWWQEDKTDQAAADRMVRDAVGMLTGEADITVAWDMLFRYFNVTRDGRDEGYRSGEKITIKINLVAAFNDKVIDNEGNQINQTGWVNTSPQMVVALLGQLVDVAGVAQSDITVGDTTCNIPNYYWDYCRLRFEDVNYLAKSDRWDRQGAVSSAGTEWETPIYWSTAEAEGFLQDYLPVSYVQADYLINFACLKGHSSGITLCAKNHYGSLIRIPSASGYYNLHDSLPNAIWSPGFGNYRAHVDTMGHSELGGKTLLFLIDGLYGGYYWHGRPCRWGMAPFGGDWPSSLFASQDPVAIDSVGHDFLKAEWPDVVSGGGDVPGALEGGAEDYLHEAAMAGAPVSGTFYDPDHAGDVVRLGSLGVHEHWNNPVDKQYSRNLGMDVGIELVTKKAGDINVDGRVDFDDLEILVGQWLGEPGEPGEPSADIWPMDGGDGFVDLNDFSLLSSDWTN